MPKKENGKYSAVDTAKTLWEGYSDISDGGIKGFRQILRDKLESHYRYHKYSSEERNKMLQAYDDYVKEHSDMQCINCASSQFIEYCAGEKEGHSH